MIIQPMHCFTWCFWFSVFASFWFLALQMMWFHSMLRSIKAINNHYSCTCHFKMSILHWRCPKSIWNCIQISRTQLVESLVVKFSFSEKATKICEKFSSWFCHLLKEVFKTKRTTLVYWLYNESKCGIL